MTAASLTTHVLDVGSGTPAAHMAFRLVRLDTKSPAWVPVISGHTNDDGRTREPLLAATAMRAGRYRLTFSVGQYYRDRGHPDAGAFLEDVPVEFIITDPEDHYHVPLLVSPWSYSTYRGS